MARRSTPTASKFKQGLLILAGVVAGGFALLFMVANDDWVTISIPSAPWNPEPRWFAFETRQFAVVLASAAVGAAIAASFFRILAREQKRRLESSRNNLERARAELENVNRLVESSRNNR